MNLLLDTHAFLWAIDNNPELSQKARDAIVNGNNIVFVSAATAWEIAIKKAIGKLKVPDGDYWEELKLHRFTPLDITTEHALAVGNLPPHHKDPFDRMLIAQASVENLTLVTRDPRIKAYAVQIIETCCRRNCVGNGRPPWPVDGRKTGQPALSSVPREENHHSHSNVAPRSLMLSDPIMRRFTRSSFRAVSIEVTAISSPS
jgi:PIN domain nuclease of toxin-antitoxin system